MKIHLCMHTPGRYEKDNIRHAIRLTGQYTGFGLQTIVFISLRVFIPRQRCDDPADAVRTVESL